MSAKNLYLSEKDQDFNHRRIISLQGDDIGFKTVQGNRKDVIDMKKNRDQILDEMEKKMRFNDIVKQYNLFFNKRLKVYDKKYINDLIDILDSNDRNYIKQRKYIEEKKNDRLFHTNQNFKFRKIDLKNSFKDFNKTTKNFKYNKKIRKIKTLQKEDSIKQVFRENESKKEDSLSKAIQLQKIKSQEDIIIPNSKNNFNKIQLNKKISLREKEKRFYVNKITKKKLNLINSDNNQNTIFSLDKKSDKNETIESKGSINKRYSSYFSDSNLNNSSKRNYFNSYFNESLREKSLVDKKFRHEKYVPLGQPIRTIDVIKLDPIIFQKPYSILGEFYKRHIIN